MELEEIVCAPFTTATTCFSCTPCSGINRKLPFQFATENHILGLSPNYRPVTVASVPRDNSSVICVGFAQYPGPAFTKEPFQALALVDLTCIDQPEDTSPPLRQPPTPDVIADGGGKDDASVVSNAHSVAQDGGSNTPMKGRKPSSAASAVGSSVTTMASSAGASLSRSKSDSSTLALDASFRSSTERGEDLVEVEGITTSLQPPKARLLLQVPTTYSSDGSMKTMVQDYVSLLDFRPLSPCLARWGHAIKPSLASSGIGIFVGSADDSQLRLYEPNLLDGRLIARTDLPEEDFQMDTPVMGMDYHSNGETHILAVVGQDGTIQITTWSGNDEQLFASISSQRFIVDGPLVSLQFQEHPEGGLGLVVGSLCGYVCRLKREAPTGEWQDPQMVVQGLWNDQLQAEDSVLAVHPFGDCIALGTLSGRCLIYRAEIYGDRYYHLWECTLPYSIHGLETHINEHGSFDLIVVTRRSLHVFRPKKLVPIWLPKPTYSIQAAKDLLLNLLRKPTPESIPKMAEEIDDEYPPQDPPETKNVKESELPAMPTDEGTTPSFNEEDVLLLDTGGRDISETLDGEMVDFLADDAPDSGEIVD